MGAQGHAVLLCHEAGILLPGLEGGCRVAGLRSQQLKESSLPALFPQSEMALNELWNVTARRALQAWDLGRHHQLIKPRPPFLGPSQESPINHGTLFCQV